jgi:FkbM family methyltransferase
MTPTSPQLAIASPHRPERWLDPPGLATLPPAAQVRIAITLACRDSDTIPKVRDAGRIFDLDGEPVQVMHDGTLVLAGGYYGTWMSRIIAGLHGHHEPQEELLFHALLTHVQPGTLLVELGAYWAFYTNWYLGAIPGSRAFCVEPEAANLEIGRRNLQLNGREAELIQACVGEGYRPAAGDESQGIEAVECLDMPALEERIGHEPIELLHMDVQGAETGFIRSMRRSAAAERVRFLVVSTHHESISGSPSTHDDCLAELRAQGAAILAEHAIAESFSGDGLIVASFAAHDRWLRLPPMSRAPGELSQLLWESAGLAPAAAATGATAWLQQQAKKLRRSWSKRMLELGVSRKRAA